MNIKKELGSTQKDNMGGDLLGDPQPRNPIPEKCILKPHTRKNG